MAKKDFNKTVDNMNDWMNDFFSHKIKKHNTKKTTVKFNWYNSDPDDEEVEIDLNDLRACSGSCNKKGSKEKVKEDCKDCDCDGDCGDGCKCKEKVKSKKEVMEINRDGKYCISCGRRLVEIALLSKVINYCHFCCD